MTEKCNYLKAVVFDWAGTTVDHGSRAPTIVFQELFRRRGIDITVDQARGPMGMAKHAHIKAIGEMETVRKAWEERFGHPLSEAEVDEMYAQFLPMQKDVLGDHCDLIDGVADAVSECRAMGLKIGSSTGYTRELMEIVSKSAADQGYAPDCVLCAEDAKEGRPKPYLLQEAARRLEVTPMAAIVKVDDTSVGIQAGRNAGCWSIGVTRTGNCVGLSEEELDALDDDERRKVCDDAALELMKAGAHYTIESVASIPALIRVIDRRGADGDRPDS